MTSKLDQIRALREQMKNGTSTGYFPERRFAGQVSPSASSPEIIYGGARGGGMSETVNNTKKPLLTSNTQRQSKWRKANPELNRQRARDGMRKLRANASA